MVDRTRPTAHYFLLMPVSTVLPSFFLFRPVIRSSCARLNPIIKQSISNSPLTMRLTRITSWDYIVYTFTPAIQRQEERIE